MSFKKKKKVIKKKIMLTISGIITIIVLIPLIVIAGLLKNSSYYKIDSRVDKLKNNEDFKDSNYKAIGWLKIQETDIDLPVLYSDDPYEEFPIEADNFVWSDNKTPGFHNMINIQGHNLFNLSAHPKLKSNIFHRFEELMSFVYYDFAKDNKYIQLTIDDKDYVYKIFSVAFVSASQKTFLPQDDELDKDDMKKQIERFEKISFYNYDIDVNENDSLISLSTCTRFYGPNDKFSFYVIGRLIRDDEKIDNYKVIKNNDNYKKVEEILMEGDEEDAEDNV